MEDETMKEGRTFMKRSLALILSAVLLLSNLSGLSMLVDAADESQEMSVTVGQIVADNYNLTDAEKAILASGYLVSEKFDYVVPGNNDGLVTVDTDNAKITAASKDGWTPVSAVIKYGSKTLNVKLNNGVGTYDAATVGNAFSVEVVYQLTTSVDKAVQEQLLNAPAYLKQGVANLDQLADQSGDLYILEQALPTLNKIATEGYTISIGSQSIVATMDNETAKNAILALQKQYSANAGRLNLAIAIEEYDQSAKTAYLTNKASGLQAEVQAMAEYATAISAWLTEVTAMMNYMDESTKSQLKILDGVIDSIASEMGALAAADWTAANLGTDLVYADANYTKLDALVAAVTETTTGLSVNENLLVATTTIQANMAMWNVTVKVILKTVNADNVVAQYGETKTVTLTLADGTSKADVLAAIKDSGIESDAIKAWGSAYVSGKYASSTSDLPSSLNKDLTYTITYAPKEYTVTVAGESNKYPYGYKLTLPKHSDATQAYDYYDEAGNYLPQGTVVTVTQNATYTRKEGAAYVTGNLLGIIADNADNAKLTAILSSGALTVNENINYREPSNLEGLVTLSGSKLTAKTYASDYEGLLWAPYSYVVDGQEKLFNGATEVTISGDFEMVQVYYRLTLSNYSVAEVQQILDLANDLVDEAAGQKSVLDALAGYRSDMGAFNKTKFAGLISAIEYANISDEMKAYFTPIVTSIVNICFDSNAYLKLYNMLETYADESTGGLVYYYQNHVAFRSELNLLASYLTEMVDSDEKMAALAILMNDAGVPQYIEKLTTLSEKLAILNEDLTPPNAAIDTTNTAALRKLTDALTMSGDLSSVKAENPYLQLGPVNRTADKYVSVAVTVVIDGKTYNVPSVTVLKETALTAEQIAALKAGVEEILKNIDGKADLYTNDYNAGAALDALAGKVLNDSQAFTYTWTVKDFTVVIEGVGQETVNLNNLTITLPKHTTAGWKYEYVIGSKIITADSYTFSLDELRTLFVNGTYTISRIETNEAVEKLEDMVANINKAMGYEALVLIEKNGTYTGIVANLDAGSVVDFVMGLTNSGYSYIGLNGTGLMYVNEETNGLEVSIQTLLDAFLLDNNFGSNTLISLGQNGKGVLLNASLQLGDSAASIVYEDLTFTINVTSVPSQFKQAANALNAVKTYVSFHSDNGEMIFDLNLPDAVYGAYLTALIATGHVDKTDVNGIDQAIAFQFLYDYFNAVTTNDNVSAETFTNTIAMLGKDVDLNAYDAYYQYFCSFLEDATTVTINSDWASLTVDVPGQSMFNSLLNLVGKDPADLSLYLAMIKEYKAGINIKATVKADLKNPTKDYNAMIVDIQASGITNKYAFTSSYSALSKKTANLAGYSAVMLMSDVSGDLTFSGTTILDLNGYVISGNVKSTGTLYIIDSSMDTYDCGGITKNVSGNVVILGGNYAQNVSSFLKAGYYKDGTAVRNELYYIDEENGNVTFVLNTDIINSTLPSVRALAVDIAADLVLNYAITAALTADGCNGWIYDVNMYDLLDLLNSNHKVDDVINSVLSSVSAPAFSDLVNMILDDLVDFAAIEAALASDSALATYTLTIAPWNVSLDHIYGEGKDYLTIGINANHDLEKTFDVSLKLEGSYTEYLRKLAAELAEIAYADINVNFQQPEYLDKIITLIGTGDALAEFDVTYGGNNQAKHEDYLTVLGVILAYGNPEKAEAIAAALNGETVDQVALKVIVDNTTVEEIFTALKVMGRNVDFAAMAAKVGVNASASAAELESVYHLILCAAGKVLEELNITGNNAKLGNLYDESTGWYVLSRENIFRSGEYTVRSYTADYTLGADALSLNVKLWHEYTEDPDIPDVPGVCEHEWSPWYYESDDDVPTCHNAGKETRKCVKCGITETREVAQLEHSAEWVTVKEATYDEEGLEQLICKLCGDVLDERIIPCKENPKDGDTTIMIVSTIALLSLMALAVVEFGFKRRFLK